MPQIMPLNWIILLLFFSLIFYWMNSLIYFFYSPKHPNIKSTSYKMNKINWQW
uniref:ATP synthase F0 subunit 8 n=1 Tax=Arctopsyche spinescens TaxID=2973067 RepID=UPI002238F94B|nr:ATP synthase F0 subunit 8 [Arctopsyche spinescens]UYO79360.1 ATP synthase F0 subunit 8 [Arctopsyche spinescens]